MLLLDIILVMNKADKDGFSQRRYRAAAMRNLIHIPKHLSPPISDGGG